MLFYLALIVGVVVAAKILFGVIYRGISGRCRCKDRMEGKTILITGASAGIGKSAAFDLASRGARIIMACRNMKKAQLVADEVIEWSGNKEVVVREVDTSDLDSVRKFAKQILAEEKSLHVLINNAGIILSSHEKSKQGFELTYATNHLGHFLLTNMLLDLLKKTGPSRILNVSSIAHTFPGFDINDLNYKNRQYASLPAYSQSKLCNVLFTKELAKRLEGTKVTVNALHPGAVDTEFLSKEKKWKNYFLSLLLYSSIKDSDLGAQTTIHLAVSKDVENITGEYFEDCKLSKSNKISNDAGVAKKLWEISEEQVQL